MVAPHVSVITPCYNAEKFIGRTIESVQSQTLGYWEHIVVDDGSKDNSAHIIESYLAGEPRLHLMRQPNGGVANARNNGFKVISPQSKYLLFLDADDCLEPSMLQVMSNYMDTHPKVGLAYCGHTYIDDNGQILDKKTHHFTWGPRYVPAGLGMRKLPPYTPETPFISIFTLAGLIPSIAIMRRSVYEQTPGWDESLGHIYEDTDMFLHLALRSKAHYVPHELLRYRQHTNQSTSDPHRVAVQQQKLYAKWRNIEGLTPDQQRIVQQAIRFLEDRFVPYMGLVAATSYLKHGEVGKAMRSYAGALRRYITSFRRRPVVALA